MAVSPLLAEHSAKVREQHRLTYPVLSDADNAYARSLGLVFEFPDDLQTIYRGFGAVLPELHGADRWELPLPTRIVVDAGGVIRSIDADPDYTRRPEPEATLEVLRGLD